MRFRIYVVTAVSALVAMPSVSFAQQPNEPKTRAEVRAELVELEQAGYQPGTADETTYPAGIQAAEAKVAARRASDGTAQFSFGPQTAGSSQSGRAAFPMPQPKEASLR